ncbi:MAG: pyrroline-5-carboxylate reductase [Planctomycetota bacterium]|jgi:pyrroline-5-carboxylate reductase
MPLKDKKLAILGVGSMGNALLQGILKASPVAAKDVIVTARTDSRLVAAREEFGVGSTKNNAKAVEFADIVLLCTKPQGVESLAKELQPVFDNDKMLISILAGRTTQNLEELFGTTVPVVRAMPNIPCMVDAGATAICGGSYASEEHMRIATLIFDAVGDVVDVSEDQMDAVTGLSGSGPAYIYMIIEALTDGGVKMGLPRDKAIKLATQTVMGSAKLVKETGLHPAILRDQVTTPGGTAIAAIHDLEDHGLRPMLISAVVTATEKSKELGGS